MKDKTQQIIKAAIQVFLKRGYVQATTQDIAKEAGVAEVTLYRKFSNKQNLFYTAVKQVIDKQFRDKISKLAEIEDTPLFFEKILRDRLTVVSRNRSLVQMLLAESSLGHLKKEIDFPILVSQSIKTAIEHHFAKKNQTVNVEQCTNLIGGVLLSHVFFEQEQEFDRLTNEQQEQVLARYLKAILSLVEI